MNDKVKKEIMKLRLEKKLRMQKKKNDDANIGKETPPGAPRVPGAPTAVATAAVVTEMIRNFIITTRTIPKVMTTAFSLLYGHLKMKS